MGGGSFGKSQGATGRDPRQLFQQLGETFLGAPGFQNRGPGSAGGLFGELENTIEEQIAGRKANPFLNALGSTGGLEDVQRRVNASSAAIPGLLQRQALNSTVGASNAASLAARSAAGGRGGLAFSGGAGAIAGRAASSVSPAIQAGLAGALNTGIAQQAQLQGGIAGQLAGLQQSGARNQFNVTEQRTFRDEDLRIGAKQRINELLASIAGGGISGSGGSASKPSGSVQVSGGAK